MPPTVSVVIPTYNSANTLKRAILSVLAQDFQDYEVIIVDDGSQDNTADIFKEFADPRLHYFVHKKNLGEAAARTTGIKMSSGTFVAFLDADDEWFPEKLKIQIDVLYNINMPIKACITSTLIEYKGGHTSFNMQNSPPSWYQYLMLGCGLDPGTTLVVSRMAFDKIGYYDTNLPRYTDWDWLLRYAKVSFPLIAVKKPLAKIYRLSSPRADTVEQATIHFLNKHSKEFLSENMIYGRKAVSRRWMEVASYYAQEHNIRKILQYLIKALVVFPVQPLHVWAWLINNWFGTKIGSIFQGKDEK